MAKTASHRDVADGIRIGDRQAKVSPQIVVTANPLRIDEHLRGGLDAVLGLERIDCSAGYQFAIIDREAFAAQQVERLQPIGADVIFKHHAIENRGGFCGLCSHGESLYSFRTMVRSQAMALTISELARAGSVGVETVRYYQRRGLLFDPRPSRHAATGRKHYGEEELRRLRFIRAAQSAGFTLEEIGELMALDASSERERARTLAQARIIELDRKIAELDVARSALRQLQPIARRMGPDHARS